MKHFLLFFSFLLLLTITKAQTYYMCSGTNSTSASSGYIYDSGAPSGYYQNYENCTFLIKSNCNGSIYLYISAFSTESGYDYLTVYNGSTTASPILGNYSGNAFPPTLVANNGFMLLKFTSDGSSTYSGFSASWNAVAGNCAPVANFNSNINSCQGSVYFTSTSLNNPTSYSWDFGDGNTSSLQNPSYNYTTAGTYSVMLTVTNNYGSNSITKNVAVNPLNFSMGYQNNSLAMYAPVTFTTDYTGAQSYSWDFGDNSNVATTRFVQHTYTALGTYSVTLNLSTLSCSTTRTLVIDIEDILSVGAKSKVLTNISVSPNPTNADATLIFSSKNNNSADINVYNALGMLIKQYKNVNLSQGENRVKISELQSGINLININTEEGSFNLKVLRAEN